MQSNKSLLHLRKLIWFNWYGGIRGSFQISIQMWVTTFCKRQNKTTLLDSSWKCYVSIRVFQFARTIILWPTRKSYISIFQKVIWIQSINWLWVREETSQWQISTLDRMGETWIWTKSNSLFHHTSKLSLSRPNRTYPFKI